MQAIKLTKDNVISLIEKYAAANRACPLSDDERIVEGRKGVEQAIDNLFASLDGKGGVVDTKHDENRAAVFDAITTERHYQELKWGALEEHPQSVGAYLTLMRVHLADAEAAWARSSGDAMALDRIRRVIAIGVACGEQHGMPKRHPISGGTPQPQINLEGYHEAGSSLAGENGWDSRLAG
jgi:hypothetical protein